MPDTEVQFDFTKADDQAQFYALSEHERDLLVERAQVEAIRLNEQRDVETAIAGMESSRTDDGRYDDQTVFDGQGSAVALKLIESGQGKAVVKNLARFKGLDHREIALALLQRSPSVLASNLALFNGVLDNQVARELIEADQGWCVAKSPSLFDGLDYTNIVERFRAHHSAYIDLVRNLGNFKGVDHKQLVLELMAAKATWIVVEDLSRFHDLDEEVARKLVEDCRGSIVLNHLESFPGVSREHILELMNQVNSARS